MSRIEVNLINPIYAKDLANILWAFDELYCSEFAAIESRFPKPNERILINVHFGSFLLDISGQCDRAIQSILDWLKDILDPRYRKRLNIQIEKLAKENLILNNKLNADYLAIEKQRLDLERSQIDILNYKIDTLKRAVETAAKIKEFDPKAGEVLIKMINAVLILNDASDRSLIISHKYSK